SCPVPGAPICHDHESSDQENESGSEINPVAIGNRLVGSGNVASERKNGFAVIMILSKGDGLFACTFRRVAILVIPFQVTYRRCFHLPSRDARRGSFLNADRISAHGSTT